MKRPELTDVIFFLIVMAFVCFFVSISISQTISDRAACSASIIYFFTLIATVFIGFYAYNIAKEQNKTSQIAYMTEILRGLADRCNEASKTAITEHSKSGDGQNTTQIERALSELVTPAIKAKEIITKMHPADFDMYKIMFYSMINSSVSTEITEKEILTCHTLRQRSKIDKQYDNARCMVEPP